MGEVIALDTRRPSSFTITGTEDETGNWLISVDDFHDRQKPSPEVYREIAEALIPIAGGMIETAEELDPSQRGGMVVSIVMYESGVIDFHSRSFNTKAKQKWFIGGLTTLMQSMRAKWGLDKSPGQDINHKGKKKQGEIT